MFDTESKNMPVAKKFIIRSTNFFICFIIKIVKKDDKYFNKMRDKIDD